MPNWCENDLRIKGPLEDLKLFRVIANGRLVRDLESDKKLDFNSFIPYPDEFKQLDEVAKTNPAMRDGYNSGGYEWCCQNWGTKWNAYNVSITRYKRSMLYKFATAWSPPLPVILAMSIEFPRLTFSIKFYECGVGYQGHYILKNGEILLSEDKAYSGRRGG